MTRRGHSTGRPRRVVISAALTAVVAGVMAGPAAVALWSSQVTVSGRVTAGAVGVDATLAPDSATIVNEARTRAALVTITNTTAGPTTQPADVTARLSVAAGLNGGITATAWPTQAPGECTDSAVPPADAATGPWVNGLTVTGDALAPGATMYLCVQTSGTARAFGVADTGSQTFTPRIDVTLSAHNIEATAATTATYTTQWIFRWGAFPDGRTHQSRPDTDRALCIDFGDAMGEPVSLTACQGTVAAPGPTQWFTWHVVGGDFSTIETGRPAGGLLTIDPDGSLVTRAPGTGGQNWQVQSASSSPLQIVSESGLCVTPTMSAGQVVAGPLSAEICNGSAGQMFVFFVAGGSAVLGEGVDSP